MRPRVLLPATRRRGDGPDGPMVSCARPRRRATMSKASSKGRKQRAARRKARVVEGQESVALSKAEFLRRFRERFYDPAFDGASASLDEVAEIAWDGYDEYRKSPRTRKAGPAFAAPAQDLAVEWLETRRAIHDAERRRRDRRSRSRVLLVNGSARSDQS